MLWWVAVGVARPVAADAHGPGSLHMRAPAQTAQAAAPDPAPDPAPAPAQAQDPPPDSGTEVIDIVEHDVARERFDGRAPTTVLTRADLDSAGLATLGDILQAMPAQSNASNAQDNVHGDGSTRISLRGLGAGRTLVLLNGRRIGNGGLGADDAVDVNTVPLAMIERIEVAKDGASIAGGADAIAGVVNVVTRAPFNGVDVSVLTSTSQRGDGVEYDASAVGGVASHDQQTYLTVSAGYQHHDPVLASDRAFSQFQDSYDFATRTAHHYLSPTAGAGRLEPAALGGIEPPGCTASACAPNGDGTWRNFAGSDGYNPATGADLYTPSSRVTVFAQAGNRISDFASVYVEGLYLLRRSSRQIAPAGLDGDLAISKDSLYNPFGVDILGYRRRFTEAGPSYDGDKVATTRLTAGVTGKLPNLDRTPSGWSYEAAITHNSTDATRDNAHHLDDKTIADALGPSMRDVDGTPICVTKPGDASTKIVYVTYTEFSRVVIPCVPLNAFRPAGAFTARELLSLTRDDVGRGNDTLDTVAATTHGRVATLPHGDITLTAGGDYRREAGDTDPPSAAATAGYSSAPLAERTSYQFHLIEGFADAAAVPYTGHDAIERVELDLGGRALHYTRYGTELTYKAGGLIRATGGVIARATYATAWRAPSIFDLAGGQTEILVTAEDPCDAGPPSTGDATRALSPTVQARCAAQGVPAGSRFGTAVQSAFTSGDAKLAPETARTATFGMVFEPPAAPGLAVSADYWHVAIADAIESLGVPAIFASCYDRGLQSFCDQIHRAATTHQITAIDQPLQNVDRTTTSGLDLAARYDRRLPGALGQVHAALEGQYLFRYDLVADGQTIHGAGYYDLGVYPHYRANLSGRWRHPGGTSAGFTLRYVGGYQECAGDDCNLAANRATAHDVDRYAKLDVFGGYDWRTGLGLTSLQVGINNALDATPPAVYNATAANSDASAYDFVGRMFYLRFTHQY